MFALLIALWSAPAFAGMSDVAEQLELTAEQKQQVTDILYKSKSERVAIKAKAAQAKLEVRRLLEQPTLDEKALNTAVDALGKAQSDLLKNRMSQLVGMRKVLSESQWTELLELWDDRREDRDDD